jgi:hypothetical protein
MTNNTMTNIEKNVMRRVRTIHTLRPLVSGGTLAALVCLLALWGIGREVWVARVFQNMPQTSDFANLATFWFAAFTHTRLLVQALALVCVASVIYLARETARLTERLFVLTA